MVPCGYGQKNHKTNLSSYEELSGYEVVNDRFSVDSGNTTLVSKLNNRAQPAVWVRHSADVTDKLFKLFVSWKLKHGHMHHFAVNLNVILTGAILAPFVTQTKVNPVEA